MISTKYITFGLYTYQIKIEKSLRKSIRVELIDKYKIRVRAPYFSVDSAIVNFVEKQRIWIENQCSLLNNYSLDIRNGGDIPYLGSNISICHGLNIGKTLLSEGTLYIDLSKELKGEVINWYKNKAKRVLTDICNRYKDIIGVNFNRVTIRSQKTRWGSCSSKKNLNFNWKILLTDMECLEYLVIHELCHLKEMNHSKKFWSLVVLYNPDYMENRKRLKDYGPLLLL